MVICGMLEKFKSRWAGHCLDVGHSVSNGITRWDDPNVHKWLMHMHLSDNKVGEDLHHPLSHRTDRAFLESIRDVLAKASNPVHIRIANRTMEDALATLEHVKSSDLVPKRHLLGLRIFKRHHGESF
jgi:hypothetical protein